MTDGKQRGVETAAALFGFVSAEAQSLDEYKRLIADAVEDVLALSHSLQASL